jgi:K+-transporting ATPase ATPase C chain
MINQLKVSVVVLAVMTVLTGFLYPLAVTLVAQAAFHSRANGSLVSEGGKMVGSGLIGQLFTKPGYFWGRPSATSPTPYNAASSGGSNLGPLNPDLAKNVRARVEAIRKDAPNAKAVPIDLATASGSGLDPHISPETAEVQVARVAAARNLGREGVLALVRRYTEGRQLGFLGRPRVNVLLLNLALDRGEASDRSIVESLNARDERHHE